MSFDSDNSELVSLIGEAATIALAEEFAGTRLYIPTRIKDDHRIALAVGKDAAMKLASHYAPDTIRVPLARELRAKHYRAQGISQAKIAVRLGMTESAVGDMLRRIRQRAS